MDEFRVRVSEAPEGGARVAWSYLGVVGGAILGALLWAVWSQFGVAVCGDSEDVQCQLGWVFMGLFVGLAVGWAPLAWALRLGWQWWLVLVTVLVSLPVWLDITPTVVVAVVFALAPAFAALVTPPGAKHPRVRAAIVVAASILTATASGLFLLV